MKEIDIETFFNTPDVKRFFFPAKLFWGKDCRNGIFDLIDRDKTIALFTDRAFAADEYIVELKRSYANQIVHQEKVEGIPKTDDVKRIGKQLGKMPGQIISVGGGSTIDTAKAVMASFLYGSFEGIGMGEKRGIPPLDGIVKPSFFSLPTTAGSGADASRYYVAYDSKTREKVHGKSWKLVADWILLDPYFVRSAPIRLIINGAFDAFIHFLESSWCRYEQSWFGEMLSTEGMIRILVALDGILKGGKHKDEYLLQLLYASTLAGMAISNVRTGSIHEAGGVILELTGLCHAETLFIFFRETYQQYAQNIKESQARLLLRLEGEFSRLGFSCWEKIMEWWEDIYARKGITADICEGIKRINMSKREIEQCIFERVFSDKVWVEKEGPLPLDRSSIQKMIHNSMKRFG
jgi:alcohol dehydrogenase class IV